MLRRSASHDRGTGLFRHAVIAIIAPFVIGVNQSVPIGHFLHFFLVRVTGERVLEGSLLPSGDKLAASMEKMWYSFVNQEVSDGL